MKKPRQRRSEESLEKVIEAAEEILRSRPADDLTVAQLVESSGVSVGAIYGRFDDKEGIFAELVSRFMRRTLREFEQIDRDAWAQKPLADFISSVVDTNANIYFAHRGVLRSLLLKTHQTQDPTMFAARQKYNRQVGRMLREMFLEHANEIDHPDIDEAVSVAIEVMTAMLREGVVFANRETLDKRAIQRTADLLLRYLQSQVT